MVATAEIEDILRRLDSLEDRISAIERKLGKSKPTSGATTEELTTFRGDEYE